MKTLITLLFAFALVAVFAGPITEGTTIKLEWTHADKTPIRLFLNGVFWRDIPTNQIFSVGSTNGETIWSAQTTAPKGGQEYKFAATAVDLNGIESEPSNTATQYIRLKGPQGFGLKEK